MTNLFIQEKYLKPENIQQLEAMGYTVETGSEPSDKAWPEVLCVGTTLNLKQPQEYTNLKYIQLFSAGYDSVDIEKAHQHGIMVANARGAYSVQIAEYVLARLLSVYKKEREFDSLQKDSTWSQSIQMHSLVDEKVAILGSGSIGQEVAKRLKPFNTDITGFNTSGRVDPHFDHGESLANIHNVIDQFDIVIICLPLNDSTSKLFNKELLLKMKETATLINIGRGPIIVESDLVEVLETHLRAVILDVFEVEPLTKDSLLWNHPKAYLTSHVSYNDNSTSKVRNEIIIGNLERYIDSEPIKNQIK
ncbi:MAG: hypothetical protein GX775_02495 [Erysipelothrix sp.]|nr:hypothetical protein [Erysipelothrix sp.]